uniref:Uncharacterized protein n=1 Tax=Manihot esculenta TaxID=3983 RepID=A0A2C9VNN3_MANES
MGSAYESKQRSHSVTGVRKGFEGCQTLMSHPKLRVLPELCQSYGEIYWHLIIFSFKKKTTVQKLSFSNGKQIGLGCEMTAIPWRSLRLLVALSLYCIAFWPQEVSETISC